MAELTAGWAQTVTAVNLAHIATLTNMDPVCDALHQLKGVLPVKEVPVNEQWRLGLLDLGLPPDSKIREVGRRRRCQKSGVSPIFTVLDIR